MSLALIATVTASTKRAGISGNKRGEPVTLLTDLHCTPLCPADPKAANDLLLRLKLETPYNLLETFVTGLHDIRAGDTLVCEGHDYIVRSVAEWAPHGATRAFLHLTIEDVPS